MQRRRGVVVMRVVVGCVVVGVAATGGLMLGLFGHATYESAALTLQAGDRLILFTDGVTEAKNPAQDDFTETRLEDFLRRTPGASLAEMIAGLVGEVQAFANGAPQADDLTVLALRYAS